jgi:hypothetical protein
MIESFADFLFWFALGFFFGLVPVLIASYIGLSRLQKKLEEAL